MSGLGGCATVVLLLTIFWQFSASSGTLKFRLKLQLWRCQMKLLIRVACVASVAFSSQIGVVSDCYIPAAKAAPADKANRDPKAASASNPAFDAAIALYTGHQYQAAATSLQKIMQADPQNKDAVLYLAHCYYALGKYGPAKNYYSWLSKNFPHTPQGRDAALMEARVPGASAQAELGSTSAGGSVSGKSSGTGAVGPSTSSKRGGAVEKFDMAKMVRVVQPAMNHPGCTPEFVEMLKNGMKQCPERVLALCAAKGCTICITPTLVDRNPELRNTRPRGYEDGHTYKNTPAMFDYPEVVVCQWAQIGENEDNVQPTDDPLGSLRHEFGHAVDAYMGGISRTEEFRHIYYLDRARVTDKEALAYYLQEGTETGGPSETFAQACCIIFGGSTSQWRKDRDVQFQQAFSNVIDYVRKKVNAI
jgi:hypothetical protein